MKAYSKTSNYIYFLLYLNSYLGGIARHEMEEGGRGEKSIGKLILARKAPVFTKHCMRLLKWLLVGTPKNLRFSKCSENIRKFGGE